MIKRIKKIVKFSIILGVLLMAVFYGILIQKFQLPPYKIIKLGYTKIKPKIDTSVPEEYKETKVTKLITLGTADDISKRRLELIRFLWGSFDLPLLLPSTIKENWKDSNYNNISSLERIEKWVVQMDFDLESNVYHFIPKNSNNKIVIYHQGHRGDFIHGKEQIEILLEKGFSVLAFSMPLMLPNNQPTLTFPHFGKLKISTHEHIKYLQPEKGHPLRYFIEPVIAGINFIEKNYNYTSIAMMGISGGGWTTTIVAALDLRITKSFPVAGSTPIYLRSNSPKDWGDYEQTVPDFYRIANYLELYILGGSGTGRKQLQILNKYDACCNAGTKWKTYKKIVQSRVSELGPGEFELFMDDSHHEHIISELAMQKILQELEH